MMSRILALLCAVMVSISAMAYDFVGKTFKGTTRTVDGESLTATMKFRQGGHMSMSCSINGKTVKSDSNMYWEVSGDYLNTQDSSGGVVYFLISRDANGTVNLDWVNDYGDSILTLKPVTASSGTKSKTKKRR